jgi:hypothetical protein
MQLVKFGTAGKMVLIGDDPKKATWYLISNEVRPFLEKFKVGDSVTIRSEKRNGTNTLLFISAEGAENKTSTSPTKSNALPSVSYNHPSSATKTYGKSQEEQDSIKRQAIGHMTSRTLIALQGQVSQENVCDLIELIYDKYVQKVG